MVAQPSTPRRRLEEPAAVGRARNYYVITLEVEEGIDVHRVWCRSADGPVATLVGEHATLEAAKASVPVSWRPALSDRLQAWGLLAEPAAGTLRSSSHDE